VIDILIHLIAAPFWVQLSAWIMIASLLAYVFMFWDKLCALRGWWRVPERTLLFWALIGGATGAKAGQKIFRHKTRKEPFRTQLNRAFAVNVVFVLGVVALESGGADIVCRQNLSFPMPFCEVSPT